MNIYVVMVFLIVFGFTFWSLIAYNFWNMSKYKRLAENNKKIFRIWIATLVSMIIAYFVPIVCIWAVIFHLNNKKSFTVNDKKIYKIIYLNIVIGFVLLFVIGYLIFKI